MDIDGYKDFDPRPEPIMTQRPDGPGFRIGLGAEGRCQVVTEAVTLALASWPRLRGTSANFDALKKRDNAVVLSLPCDFRGP